LIHKPNFFVFTGGPGVGKTTLLRHLQALGELTVEENARAVIREQVACGGAGVPWADPALYADLVLARDVVAFDRFADEARRVFFDRGIGDMYGAEGVEPSAALIDAIRTRRYNARIFVFPPWAEIYETDAERRQDWAEAERTFGRILSLLPEIGYKPLLVPKASVAERAAFVLAHTAAPDTT
jgi:predicted ATPase